MVKYVKKVKISATSKNTTSPVKSLKCEEG